MKKSIIVGISSALISLGVFGCSHDDKSYRCADCEICSGSSCYVICNTFHSDGCYDCTGNSKNDACTFATWSTSSQYACQGPSCSIRCRDASCTSVKCYGDACPADIKVSGGDAGGGDAGGNGIDGGNGSDIDGNGGTIIIIDGNGGNSGGNNNSNDKVRCANCEICSGASCYVVCDDFFSDGCYDCTGGGKNDICTAGYQTSTNYSCGGPNCSIKCTDAACKTAVCEGTDCAGGSGSSGPTRCANCEICSGASCYVACDTFYADGCYSCGDPNIDQYLEGKSICTNSFNKTSKYSCEGANCSIKCKTAACDTVKCNGSDCPLEILEEDPYDGGNGGNGGDNGGSASDLGCLQTGNCECGEGCICTANEDCLCHGNGCIAACGNGSCAVCTKELILTSLACQGLGTALMGCTGSQCTIKCKDASCSSITCEGMQCVDANFEMTIEEF